MQKFIDLLEMMFGDLDIDDINISESETKTTKGLREEAEMAETASIVAETGTIPKDKITRVYITSLPVPHKFGIPPDSLPQKSMDCHQCTHQTDHHIDTHGTSWLQPILKLKIQVYVPDSFFWYYLNCNSRRL